MATLVSAKGVPLPMGYGRASGEDGLFPTSLVLPTIVFDATPNNIPLDLTFEIAENMIDIVQCMYVDNRNAGAFSININGFCGDIVLKGFKQGWFPIACPPDPKFILKHVTPNAVVNLAFANVPVGMGVWDTQ